MDVKVRSKPVRANGQAYPAYKVTTTGKVFSRFNRGIKEGREAFKEEWVRIRATKNKAGVGLVALFQPGDPKPKRYSVAALVLEAFKGPRPEGKFVRYEDGDKDNCDLSNLSWGERVNTRSEDSNFRKGSTHANAKMDEKKVRKLRKLYKDGKATQVQLAEMFGINQVTVSAIVTRKTWAHLDDG